MSDQPLTDSTLPQGEAEDRVNLDEHQYEDTEDAPGDDNEDNEGDDDDYEEEEEEDEETQGDAGEEDGDQVHIEGEGQTNGDKQNLTALLLGDPKADDEEDEEDEEEDDDDDDDEEYVEDNNAFNAKKRPIDEVVGDNDVEKDSKKVKA